MIKRSAVGLLLLLAAACGGKSTPASTATAKPKVSRPPVSGGQVNRPVTGSYTYTLSTISGAALPAGMERIEALTISGDIYTSVISDNKNSNHVTFYRRWTAAGELLESSDAVANASERKCIYRPPIKVIPIPLKTGKLARQAWQSPDLACSGTTDLNVLGPASVSDAKGKTWSTWKVEEVTTSGGGTSTQLHWFSPELGVDIRDQSSSPGQSTLSVLRDYPV